MKKEKAVKKEKLWLLTFQCDVGQTTFKSRLIHRGRKPNIERLAKDFYYDSSDLGNNKAGDGYEFTVGLLSIIVTPFRCEEITQEEAEVFHRLGVA